MTYFKKGSWNAICDVCGEQYKSDELKETWDKLMACRFCWEPRHPQDFVRAKADRQTVPWSRVESEDQFVSNVCLTLTGVAGEAIVGCAIVGRDDQYNCTSNAAIAEEAVAGCAIADHLWNI